jgi:hypothetical protein
MQVIFMLLSRGMKAEKCENALKAKLYLTIFVNFLYKFKCEDVVYAQQIRNIFTRDIDESHVIARSTATQQFLITILCHYERSVVIS